MKLIIIKWREIPTQVMIKKGRKTIKKALLTNRFMEAVDKAAMRSGAVNSDAYLNDWQDEVIRISSGDPEHLLTEKVRELEANFPSIILQELIKNGGYQPE